MPEPSATGKQKPTPVTRRPTLTRRPRSGPDSPPVAADNIAASTGPEHGIETKQLKPSNAPAAMPDDTPQQLADRTSVHPSPEITHNKPASLLKTTHIRSPQVAQPADPSLPSPRTNADFDDVIGDTGGKARQRQKEEGRDISGSITSSQSQLNQYRERLARDLERRENATRGALANASDKARVSPIQEESFLGSPPTSINGPTTASTESGNTVRGGWTPGYMAGTPSYPFPRMATTPGLNRSFQNFSSSATNFMSHAMSFDSFGAQDKVLSGSSTPASAMTFHPSGASERMTGDFPSPNLYDLSLMLNAEPGLDAWWTAVVQIMRDAYKAERVTLSVPADSTDIENVPWGQKATYNEHDQDELSLGYLARASSFAPSSDCPPEVAPSQEDPRVQSLKRPGLQSRHSFTSYEDKREDKSTTDKVTQSRRPKLQQRSQSYLPSSQITASKGSEDHSSLNQRSLKEHDAEEIPFPAWEGSSIPAANENGRVLPVLQALDYEADPLIDHAGVTRVLERGRVIALTRSYPYLQKQHDETPSKAMESHKSKDDSKKKKKKQVRKPKGDSSNKLSTLLGSANAPRSAAQHAKRTGANKSQPSSMISQLTDEEPEPLTPSYEEFEQPPPSPWSQSPAPSPAVRADPQENPFFTDATVDEDSFNPESTTTPDYTSTRPPEAIGVDNSWTVLHIPLTHVLLSKPTHSFRLDSSALEQKSNAKGHNVTGESRNNEGPASPEGGNGRKDKPNPIAILSVLSPLIPYPSNLRQSLHYLGPHLATSFSLCRHYSNLETELAGLQRRRPQTSGFGAIASDGRPLMDAGSMAAMGSMAPEMLSAAQHSLAGSLTSPSDYSGVSRSAAGSPSGTPNWDQGSLSMIMDKRPGSSPAQAPGTVDSYFSVHQKPSGSRTDVSSAGGSQRTRRSSKESSAIDRRQQRLSASKNHQDTQAGENEVPADQITADETRSTSSALHWQLLSKDKVERPDEPSDSRLKSTDVKTPDIPRHTMLHSYGADFSSSFQSLPQSSSMMSKPVPYNTPARSGSMQTGPADMPPPSDRLKGLMLDALPAHVFVSLPQTGEVVWVNSRYLTYRGQTVADLAVDPWGSIHPEDREEYLKAWGHSLRTGEQFSRTVRIRRFDGVFRWFYARAVASRDKRGVLMQFLGSYMDIHDQHIAELKAARQEEIEASEAKHRLLANLIPQIIFTATEDEGITFANDQWLSYTGQSFEDCLGLGFMEYVHPDDLANCRIPTDQPPTPLVPAKTPTEKRFASDKAATSAKHGDTIRLPKTKLSESNLRGIHQALSRNNSSSSSSVYELPTADLHELARKGIVKVTTDSNGRLSYTTEVRLRSKSGEYRWHLVRCVEIDNIDFGSGVSSYFGSATDINDHKLLEAKLKEAMESKSRFLSNMSHEIRTPLIGISGMVSFLQDTTLNEEQRDYTNTIQTSANSLLMIINDILDLSKVDAGMMKLKYEWFHTRALIEDVNELVSTMAIAKRLELNYVVDEDVPTWVKGDRVRIRQVLLNVIGNAIKFTTQGEVFSRCRIYKDNDPELDEDEIMLEFATIDTGRGFTKEESELIFKPFSQIDGSSTRQHGGSGLGLVISRQLTELHGGKMEGTAVPGKGSTFKFTARFNLPTEHDRPEVPASPRPVLSSRAPSDKMPLPPASLEPLPPTLASPQSTRLTSKTSPAGDNSTASLASSGSSDPSIQSGHTPPTERSSVSSVNVGLVHFSEAARASGQDLSQMKLEIPSSEASSGSTPTHDTNRTLAQPEDFRPPMYSILIICPQTHSREATTQHIEQVLPKDVPRQITALATVDEAVKLIGGEDPVHFTHMVFNLPTPEEIMSMMEKTERCITVDKTTVLILSDTGQRQAVINLAAETGRDHKLNEDLVTFINKPVKPSRFAVIFDPENSRDSSIDRNRSTAQRMVEDQKQSYQEIEKRMGNRGYKVLLVEDNIVNQKVLQKYLKKVGVVVEIAADGVEGTDMVLSHDHDYYSLILCDLHMPRKDGYQTCREIRQWEQNNRWRRLPIIALSANVMSDVADKCTSAGFSDYVTKPVDFIDLSRAMSKFF